MDTPSDTRLVARPLICFGSVVIAGAAGFALTRNGFSFLAFLLLYIPVSLLVSIIGAIYTVKAYAGLPRGHWGRLALNVLIVIAILGLAWACFLVVSFSSHPPGGF